MNDVWTHSAQWWVDAVRDDPSNSDDFVAVIRALADGVSEEALTLDVGCGEGQIMRALGGRMIGVDASAPLLALARSTAPVVRARLPHLGWARSGVFDRCVCVAVIELVADLGQLFGELHRVTRPGGALFVVMNHPVTTAPHAEPLADPNGEVLWRWGRYLVPGQVGQDLGGASVVFHHRSIGELLTTAASSGWHLDRSIEHGPSAASLDRHDDLRGQEQIPALLGLRWSKGY